MKAAGIAFVAGLLGVLIGSLAAQAPLHGVPPMPSGPLHEGRLRMASMKSGAEIGKAGETARVYDGWVFLMDSGRFIPREEIGYLAFQNAERPAEDFGDDPQPGTPREPERPRKPTFRED